MIVAFCLYKYFPFGGLQRDFMRIASTVAARGHHVRVYTQSWEGECPKHLSLFMCQLGPIPTMDAMQNIMPGYKIISKRIPLIALLGLIRCLGWMFILPLMFVTPRKLRKKRFLYRLTSRYRHYAAFERATFEHGKSTKLMMLTDKQITDFQKHYQTEPERFKILPPGIYPDRKYSAQIPNSREIYRQKNGIKEQQNLLLQVGSDFVRKGVDRSIEALAALPESLRHNTLLFVVGQDKPRKFEVLAEKLGVRSNVHFFSGRNDVSELMAAADLLLHPAYQEAAGIVLLEAITAGLPVLTTAVCGYAHYIADANCGTVIAEPFSQEQLNEVLRKALTQSSLRMAWAENARHYADTQDLYSLPEKAADIITGGLDG